MFQEVDRVNLRHFLGFGSIFLQADPRLENAITAVQSVADGGTRPDSSTEAAIKTMVTSAQAVEAKLANLWDQMQVVSDNQTEIDPMRAAMMLRSEGRRVVHGIARMLGLKGPRADVFGVARVAAHENPFSPEY
jgi:hypothetical protein